MGRKILDKETKVRAFRAILIAAILFVILIIGWASQNNPSPSQYDFNSDNFDITNFLSGEVDETTVLNQVIDGDTFDTNYGRIRLADVNAPETGEYGFYDAKNTLISFLSGKTIYLDIDDEYETDRYGRFVCVVYVKHNSTHFMNVNEALVEAGVIVVDNYDNEFFPDFWTLYSSTLKINQSQNTDNNQPKPDEKKFVGSRNSDVCARARLLRISLKKRGL